MTKQTKEALDRAGAAVRAALARLGVAWDRAWYHLKRAPDSGVSTLTYTDRPGGAVESVQDDSGAAQMLARLRADIPDAAGRPWNQALLTLYADGRQDCAFDYPGPAPEPGRSYAEPEILANMAACARRDLAFDRWTEAWVEAGPKLIPFLSCRDGPDGPIEQLIDDCNGLDQWLDRLWAARQEAGHGPWGRVIVHLLRDSDRIETEFRPPEPGAAKPPPLPPPVPPLDELFRQIAATERAELDDTCRRMEEMTRVRTRWKRVRVTALRGDDNVVYVDHVVELTDGRKLDEPADEEVEDLFNQVYDRLDGGDDPSGLAVPGLKVKAGESPRFSLVLTNDRPK